MNSVRKRKLRVVADTNIIISALHFGGEAETFLGMAASRLFNLYISPYILWEAAVILEKKFGWSKEMIHEVKQGIREISKITRSKERIDVIKNDKADNRILECAIAAKADILVSNDKKHLVALRAFRGIKIVDLYDFLREFKP